MGDWISWLATIAAALEVVNASLKLEKGCGSRAKCALLIVAIVFACIAALASLVGLFYECFDDANKKNSWTVVKLCFAIVALLLIVISEAL